MFSNRPASGAEPLVELSVHADGAVAFSFPGPDDDDKNKDGDDGIDVLPQLNDGDDDIKILYEYINLD